MLWVVLLAPTQLTEIAVSTLICLAGQIECGPWYKSWLAWFIILPLLANYHQTCILYRHPGSQVGT